MARSKALMSVAAVGAAAVVGTVAYVAATKKPTVPMPTTTKPPEKPVRKFGEHRGIKYLVKAGKDASRPQVPWVAFLGTSQGPRYAAWGNTVEETIAKTKQIIDESFEESESTEETYEDAVDRADEMLEEMFEGMPSGSDPIAWGPG